MVEEIFGWGKTVAGLRKARFIGLPKVKAQTICLYLVQRIT
jgi:hypothetical protein